MERFYSHIVFTVKNSRYDYQRILRKKQAGFIAKTFPLFEGKEEEMLVNILCMVAIELKIEVIEMNFCEDHLHAIICSDHEDVSKITGLWKGKTAYIFNRKMRPDLDQLPAIKTDGTKQELWAKSYYQRIIKEETELTNTIIYVRNNRVKHKLRPFSPKTIETIRKTITVKK